MSPPYVPLSCSRLDRSRTPTATFTVFRSDGWFWAELKSSYAEPEWDEKVEPRTSAL